MRMTGTSGWMERNLTRTLRLSAVALGVGLVMASGPVRAGDDEDDKTFEEKVIEGIMAGIGGTNMENRGIEYRERSPLVVPPRLDLPPPEAAKGEIKAANWPKDPDEAKRKAVVPAFGSMRRSSSSAAGATGGRRRRTLALAQPPTPRD